ncbi:MarR family winged helix-turn-helix transcriptional regulator [Streptomyces sp. AK04-3B]|uniref:MarR family winged helix-turn-helix transcriptional regulator n=1 Tax=unclassified Streptomyces TaxID=2593676 RepID=UPI0029A3F9F1|nr:MarR family transcriptional regulator [Streptomyces sp. AK04-3B]MDX3801134.1 MarR family transcriptional regulator [Streptomyces sp. AK04-3B]
MAEQVQFEELAHQLSAVGAVKRDLGRILPQDCSAGSAAVLTLLGRHGDMRMSSLSELLAVDMSVTSRHAAHLAERGWILRSPDPADKRSRILHLTPEGHAMLSDLYRRTTDLLAERLGDWTDAEVGQLVGLLTRLRASFGECRTVTHRPPAPPDPPPPAAHRPPGLPLPVREDERMQTTRTPAQAT